VNGNAAPHQKVPKKVEPKLDLGVIEKVGCTMCQDIALQHGRAAKPIGGTGVMKVAMVANTGTANPGKTPEVENSSGNEQIKAVQDDMKQGREATGDRQITTGQGVSQIDDRGRNRGRLDRAVQAKLGGTLRAAYQALIDEPVPSKFLTLLARLDRAEEID
jgi:hypothetical protein